nr:SHOCT domain-containing protein [Salinibaculum sp. KK48]
MFSRLSATNTNPRRRPDLRCSSNQLDTTTIVLLILLGGGYLVFRRADEGQTPRNPAMEELRTAYARGDLTDEEFESRRDKLGRTE